MSKKDQFVEVGERVRVFRVQYRVKNLRRAVDVALAKRGEKHQDAASRADVTPTWWSRILNAERISEHDLTTIAKGCGFKSLVKFKKVLELEDGDEAA